MPGLSRTFAALAMRARPGPRPLASYDFTSGVLPPGVTFARASLGSYCSSAGQIAAAPIDAPRFDHDRQTHAPLGLLIEPAATNLLLQSAAFDSAAWTKIAVTVSASQTAAPDGSLLHGLDVGDGYILQDAPSIAGQSYTSSVWLKANQPCTLGFRKLTTNNLASIPIAVGTDWVRFQANGLANAATARFLIDCRSVYSYGAAGLTLYIWRPQLERGSPATSEIQTAGAAVTRAADILSVTPHQGVFDIRLTYGDDTTQDLIATPLSAGWSPSPANRHLKRLDVYAAGSL